MKASTLLISGVACAVFAWSTACVAYAHSFPEAEQPSAGQTVNASPAMVTIKYDAPIEKLFAKLEVVGPDGQNVAENKPTVSDDGYTLSAKLPTLKPGQYLVKWHVVCVDTHHTEGSYTFTVAGGS